MCVQSRIPGLEYFIEHHKGQFVIMANLVRAGASAFSSRQITDRPDPDEIRYRENTQLTWSTVNNAGSQVSSCDDTKSTFQDSGISSNGSYKINSSGSYRIMTAQVSNSGWGVDFWRPLPTSASPSGHPTSSQASEAFFEIADMDVFDGW